MQGRNYLFKEILHRVHVLPEGFRGDLECVKVSEQILQGLHGLKRERRGKTLKLGVVGAEGK